MLRQPTCLVYQSHEVTGTFPPSFFVLFRLLLYFSVFFYCHWPLGHILDCPFHADNHAPRVLRRLPDASGSCPLQPGRAATAVSYHIIAANRSVALCKTAPADNPLTAILACSPHFSLGRSDHLSLACFLLFTPLHATFLVFFFFFF